MMVGSATVLHVALAIVLVTSAEESQVWQKEINTESLHPSSHVYFENLATPISTEAFHSSNTEHPKVDILPTSQDTKQISTLASSVAAPQKHTEVTSTLTFTPIATSEAFKESAKTSMVESPLAATANDFNATHLYPVEETYIQRAESVLHSLDVTHFQSLESSVWFTISSEPEIGYTLLHSHATIFESTTSLVWNHSASFEDQSSTMAGYITPSQPAGATIASTKVPTTHSTAPPKSVTDKPASVSTSSRSSTPVPPLQSSSEELTYGAKIAIGIIATLCILGVIVAAVVLYQRFNITHRSLKSFLTSGVRYKTYKNATYKDDEVVGDVGIVSELT